MEMVLWLIAFWVVSCTFQLPTSLAHLVSSIDKPSGELAAKVHHGELMEPHKQLYCKLSGGLLYDANCTRALETWTTVLKSRSGGEDHQCEKVTQNIWVYWEKEVCLSSVTIKTPEKNVSRSGFYSMKLLADPKDLLSPGSDYHSGNTYSPNGKRIKVPPGQAVAAVAIPFCTSKVLVQFVCCKNENDNPSEYVFSCIFKPRFFGYEYSSETFGNKPRPSSTPQQELETTQAASRKLKEAAFQTSSAGSSRTLTHATHTPQDADNTSSAKAVHISGTLVLWIVAILAVCQ